MSFLSLQSIHLSHNIGMSMRNLFVSVFSCPPVAVPGIPAPWTFRARLYSSHAEGGIQKRRDERTVSRASSEEDAGEGGKKTYIRIHHVSWSYLFQAKTLCNFDLGELTHQCHQRFRLDATIETRGLDET